MADWHVQNVIGFMISGETMTTIARAKEKIQEVIEIMEKWDCRAILQTEIEYVIRILKDVKKILNQVERQPPQVKLSVFDPDQTKLGDKDAMP